MLTGNSKPNYDIKSIVDKETIYLSANGPSLANFRVYGAESPFSKFTPKSHTQSNGSGHIRLASDKNSNIRALYYLLMVLGFDQGSPVNSVLKLPERCDHLCNCFRAFLLSDGVNPQVHAHATPNPHYFKILKQGTLSKKLILQVFQLLLTNPSEDILSLVGKYPIVDTLMIMFVRAMVTATHGYEISKPERKIQTEVLVESVKQHFGVKIEANAFQVIVEDQFMLREENDYTYVKHQPIKQETPDSTKKTEESDNSQVFDKSKILGEISPLVPMLNLKSSKPGLVSLCDIRQCSSKRNSFDEQRYHPMKPRQVISEIDSSCQSSSVSCIVERIEFRKNNTSRNASPRVSPKKQQSKPKPPSKQVVIKQSNKRTQYLESPIIPNMQKKVSQFTIVSVGEEEDKIALNENIDEDVKMTLIDGMTSEAVLKLMSPSIAKVMDQKKKQSLKNVMEKYSSNQNSCLKLGQGTLRTSCNANATFSTKLVSEFDISNDKSRISPAPRPVAKSLLKQVCPTAFKSPKIIFTYGNKPVERGIVHEQKANQTQPIKIKRIEKSLSPLRVVVQNQIIPKQFYY